MITKVHIRGYRKFKNISFEPNPEMNILVGGNEAGKSTLLEAIAMALTGKFEGFNAAESLNPYWFNTELVNDFFEAVAAKCTPLPAPPEFRIDLYLQAPDGELQKMRGINNMLKEDSVGLSIHAHPDADYKEELEHYFSADDCPRVLPIEYYRLDWYDFAGQPVFRRPKDFGVAVIDTRTIRSDRGMDYYTRQLVEERLDPKIRNKVSVEHRKMRASLGDSLMSTLNEALKMDSTSISSVKLGIQVDQSRSTSWANTLVPEIDRIPFAQAGKGTQAIVKTILSMGCTSTSSNYLLIEEPENHLSHTRLRELLSYIEKERAERQVFITTHSSYVLNRLGLDQLILLHNGELHGFRGLSDKTSEYFKRLSGFDTLRLVLADKIVLVEGPSDEIMFNRFFSDHYDREPLDCGVDVMSIGGVSFRRGFELASLLKRPLIALRDNDDKDPSHWKDQLQRFIKTGERDLFIGEPEYGRTLEYQICRFNDENVLREVLELKADQRPLEWMLNNKTDAALKIADSQHNLTPPKYMKDAIEALSIEDFQGAKA